MPGKYGHFCWYELMTTDTAAAERFYRAVVGWGAQPQDGGYTLFTAGEQPVAGLMAVPPEVAGAPPAWLGYISVVNVDTAAAEIAADGGVVHRPPADIPGVGRFAPVSDPQGAAFVIMQPDPYMPPPEVPFDAPGHVGWRELNAADGPTALPFYARRFGWTEAAFPPMGDAPLGGEQPEPMFYQLFSTVGDDGMTGGIGTKQPEAPVPHWVFYLTVDDIDAATARVRDGGGQVLLEPMQVPGGGWIINALDPQGALFALTGPRV